MSGEAAAQRQQILQQAGADLHVVDAFLRPAGFGDVFDDWGAKYRWMQSFTV